MADDAAYPYDTAVVSELLKHKKMTRGIRSCFPCRHRKVRCDGHVPCSSCVRRNHPELCRVPTSSAASNGAGEQPQQQLLSRDASPSSANTPTTNGLNLDAISNSIAYSRAQLPAEANSLISKLDDIQEQISSLRSDIGAMTTTASAGRSPLSASDNRTPRTQAKSPGRHVVEYATGATIYLGSRSDTPLALGCRQMPSVGGLMRHDALADQFVPRAYPFTNLWGADATINDIYETLPDEPDIIRYWQAYQLVAYPFYPALVTMDTFAQALFSFLDQRALAQETSNPAKDPNPSWLSLLFAVLACGVQFSDDPINQRDLRSKVLICSSFECLRRSNFFNQTDLDQIQAMALLGYCLRNNLDTNSAWILMGSTTRLGQSIGLHELLPSLSAPEQLKRSRMWWMLVWQDTFLSITYDRPPSTLIMSCPIPYQNNPERWDFQECIFNLCRLLLDKTRREMAGDLADPLEIMSEYKRELDEVRDSGAPFLKDRRNCVSLQDHLERLALGIHLGYAVCKLIRVYLDSVSPDCTFPANVAVECVQHAMQVVECFLDLHRFSAAVCRSWAFVHTSVSCAITLKSLGHVPLEDQRKPEMLVQKMIGVLEREEKESEWTDTESNVRYFGPYTRALKALRETHRDSRISLN